MKVHVLGANGMLGRYVSEYLSKKFEVVRYTRQNLNISSEEDIIKDFVPRIGEVVINCAGVIKPQIQKIGLENTVRINSLAPHVLNTSCKIHLAKFIHITTDCVFSGKQGKYTENSTHDALDEYGKSKSLGEPPSAMVIRTSIIGEEKENKRSLVEWVKAQAGKDANGFTNHLWNGITCLQFAKCVEEIIDKNLSWEGVRHVHSPEDVTKFELLGLLNDSYKLGINIKSVEAAEGCDRTLRSVHPSVLTVPSLKQQIEEMKNFNL